MTDLSFPMETVTLDFMSRGPGKLQQAIWHLIHSQPDGAWTIEDLCYLIYEGIDRVEKKHRVAVIRAVDKIIVDDPDWTLLQSDSPGCPLVLAKCGNL